MNQPPPPFSCTYSPNIPELLLQLNCSLALSTYQAGKVVFVSPKDENYLVQLPRNFQKAMGISVNGQKMVLATKDEVLVFSNSKELAAHYPRKVQTYDSLFMPRASYYTGAVDIHDIAWGKQGEIFAVNTSFSCLIQIDHNYSFTPYWQPPFISKLASEDRCHLNGMAMKDGMPKYVTAFNQGDSHQSWRETVTTTGILMDVTNNEIIAEGLPMPHSPRLFDGRLLLLLSATGQLAEVDLNTGKYEALYDLGGFVRGMDKYGDYLFIGLSRLRQNSSTFAKLDIAKFANHSGIVVLHLPTMSKVGEIIYQTSVDEIYDIHVLPDMIRPNILNTDRPDYKLGLYTPEATFWAAPQAFQEGEMKPMQPPHLKR